MNVISAGVRNRIEPVVGKRGANCREHGPPVC